MEEKFLIQERNNALIMFAIFPLIVALIIIIVLLFYNSFIDLKETYKIISYVWINGDKLEKYINGEIEESKLGNKIDDIHYDCNEETCFVIFEVDSSGFATNTCYTGFYYSEKDIIHKFQFEDREIIGDNINRYSVREINGDDILYLKKIKKHWYYYESCY